MSKSQEQVMNKSRILRHDLVIRKWWASHDQIMTKSRTSHELPATPHRINYCKCHNKSWNKSLFCWLVNESRNCGAPTSCRPLIHSFEDYTPLWSGEGEMCKKNLGWKYFGGINFFEDRLSLFWGNLHFWGRLLRSSIFILHGAIPPKIGSQFCLMSIGAVICILAKIDQYHILYQQQQLQLPPLKSFVKQSSAPLKGNWVNII